jgi:hypothetical protein
MTYFRTLYQLDSANAVEGVLWKSDTIKCAAISVGNGLFEFSSFTEADSTPVVAPEPCTLADCILAAHVILGLIPPHNFDSIPSPWEH